MSALAWRQSTGPRSTAPLCECCQKNRVRWHPSIAGYPVGSDHPLADHFGVCSGCRTVWERSWAGCLETGEKERL